jgi:hypothetical protein
VHPIRLAQSAGELAMRRLAIMLVALILVPVAAIAQAFDWKLYGGATMPDGETWCFYDAASVISSSRHLRVWTKCLLQKEIFKVNVDHDFGGEIPKIVARKIVDRYIPPIAIVEVIDLNKTMLVIGAEQIANIGNINPNSRILYEIDCSEKMIRELSVQFVAKGQQAFADKPGEWQHVPPETNGSRLFRILNRGAQCAHELAAGRQQSPR